MIYFGFTLPSARVFKPEHSGALLCVTVQHFSSWVFVGFSASCTGSGILRGSDFRLFGLFPVNGRLKARSGRARSRRARTPEPPLSSAFTFGLVALEPPLVPPPGLADTAATGPGSDFRKNHGACLDSPENRNRSLEGKRTKPYPLDRSQVAFRMNE